MCDWARDVYRPAILKELKILSNNATDNHTVTTDTDIFSTRERLAPPSFGVAEVESSESQPRSDNTFTRYQKLDGQCSAIRHVSAIRTRFLCFLITADNVTTFLTYSGWQFQKLCARQMLSMLQHNTRRVSHLLTGSMLRAIEKIWCGFRRSGVASSTKRARFYTTLQLNYYFSKHWEQCRDLCVMAVSEDAFEALVAASGLKPGRGKTKPPETSSRSQEIILDSIRRARDSSARENLLAAIARLSCWIGVDPASGAGTSNVLLNCDSAISKFVNCISKLHQPDISDPDVPFLRISEQNQDQALNSKDQEYFKCIQFPKSALETGVLITAEVASPDEKRVCLYIFREMSTAPTQTDVGKVIEQNFNQFDVFHTMKEYGPSQSNRWNWDLSETYGKNNPQELYLLSAWMRDLHGSCLTLAGIGRSGRAMFHGYYRTWRRPRLSSSNDLGAQDEARQIRRLVRDEANLWAFCSGRDHCSGRGTCVICTGPRRTTPVRPEDVKRALLSDLTRHLQDGHHDEEFEYFGNIYGKNPYPKGVKATKSCVEYYRSIQDELCAPCRKDTDPTSTNEVPLWFKILVLEGHAAWFLHDPREPSFAVSGENAQNRTSISHGKRVITYLSAEKAVPPSRELDAEDQRESAARKKRKLQSSVIVR